MTELSKLTKAQKRKFYREAVQETLVSIYGKSQADSRGMVAAWWKRASDSGDTRSDLFFHAEPLHVAADIAHMRSIEITTDNEEKYRTVLHQARKRALETTRSSQVVSEPLRAPVAQSNVPVRKAHAEPAAKKRVLQQAIARG